MEGLELRAGHAVRANRLSSGSAGSTIRRIFGICCTMIFSLAALLSVVQYEEP